METPRKAYSTDVSDAEWTFLLPYLSLMREDAPQREHPLRELFNALRYLVKTGCGWRLLPHDLPPWTAVYQQARRWLHNGVFEQIAHDLRAIARALAERQPDPSAVIFDARTLQSTPESGERAGFDGHKKRKGSKVHAAVDTLGHLLALIVSPADMQERDLAGGLAEAVQEATGNSVTVAYVDQGYTGAATAEDTAEQGVELIVVKHHEAKRGFVLLPRRWVVERTFGWLGRFRRLARDYERLPETLAAWHWVAFIALMLARLGLQCA
jgi:transposase